MLMQTHENKNLVWITLNIVVYSWVMRPIAPTKTNAQAVVISPENDAEWLQIFPLSITVTIGHWAPPGTFLKTEPFRLFPINTGGNSLCSSKRIKQMLLLTPVLPGWHWRTYCFVQ